MKKNINFAWRFTLTTCAVVALAALSSTSHAQSGSKRAGSGTQQTGSMSKQSGGMTGQSGSMSKESGSMSKNMSQQAALGLEGYCPVCVVSQGKWVKGVADHASTYDGVRYLFPSAEVQGMFDANPAAFITALGGDCTVCFAMSGKRMPGNIRFSAVNNERLFLFPSDKERQVFWKAPAKYGAIDLAANGQCIVCKVKAGKDVPGNTAFTAVHKGLRYQFPSDAERQVFMASPAEFAAEAANSSMKDSMMGSSMKDPSMKGSSMKGSSMKGSSSKNMDKSNHGDMSGKMMQVSMVKIQGKSGCAACEFGVTPINAPDELGFAVTAQDGRVFVIEDVHSRWPQLYKSRFEGNSVAVSGNVIKTEGKFTWIKPSDIKTL